MVAIILLLALAVPVTAAPGISSISPSYAYNGAKVTGIVITGTGFNITSSLGGVRLRRYWLPEYFRHYYRYFCYLANLLVSHFRCRIR